jgi:hypothetical protein
MTTMSRRTALVAACGSAAGGVTVGTWLVRTWVRERVPDASEPIRTGFGLVRLVASRREPGSSPDPSHAGHDEQALGVWPDRVVVLVEVRNDSRQPVRVAPGQFRLRVLDSGTTVTFVRAEPHGGVVAPGRVMELLLTFLAPPGPETFALEFAEAGGDVAGAAALSPASTRAATL